MKMKLYTSLAIIVIACIATPVLPQRWERQQDTYCRDPNTHEGICIALKDCQPLVDELLVKQTDETFKSFLRASRAICGGFDTNVCCPSINQRQFSTTSRLMRNSNETPRRLPTYEEGCGVKNNTYNKIVGGEVSQKGTWPWIALIGYDDELADSPFKCGGALITARHVITAAHCLRPDLSFVRLGEHDLRTDLEAQHIDIPVIRIEKHPDYNSQNGHSDLVILYLQRNVEFTEFISPICMPISSALRKKSYVRFTPFVAGWGKTTEGGFSANVLQELQISVYENQVCQERYQQLKRLFTDNQFDKAVLCAGALSGGKDTCQGDSGGPLMIPQRYGNEIYFYSIGVVAYGIGCGRPLIPSIYTSTQYFMDWIEEKITDTA